MYVHLYLYIEVRFIVVVVVFSPAGSPGPLDPYDNYFRSRLVCVLLDTCGLYFDHGTTKKKLDAFLVFFQVQCV